MNTAAIIDQIDEQIAQLQQAKALLSGTGIKKPTGRPKGLGGSLAPQPQSLDGKPAKRAMSAEGKARIAKAQKARWAKIRKAAKKAASH